MSPSWVHIQVPLRLDRGISAHRDQTRDSSGADTALRGCGGRAYTNTSAESLITMSGQAPANEGADPFAMLAAMLAEAATADNSSDPPQANAGPTNSAAADPEPEVDGPELLRLFRELLGGLGGEGQRFSCMNCVSFRSCSSIRGPRRPSIRSTRALL